MKCAINSGGFKYSSHDLKAFKKMPKLWNLERALMNSYINMGKTEKRKSGDRGIKLTGRGIQKDATILKKLFNH